MTVATKTQPNYTTQDAATYKAAIDAITAVHDRFAGAFAPHEQNVGSPAPDLSVRIDAGFIFSGVTLTEVAAQTVSGFTTPSSGQHRIDRVVIDEVTGAASRVAGTAVSGSPSATAPAIPTGKLPCCQILLTDSSTSILNSMITDERIPFAQPDRGNQSFRRLVGFPASTTTYTVTAQECVTKNPTSGAIRQLGSVNVTSSDLSAAQGASAANGRDQSGTFSAGVIFCYVISGPGQTTALLFSTSETAPTLPTNYSEWAIVGPLRWGGSTFDQNYRYRGNTCCIDGGVNVLSGGTATTETSVSMSGYVPTSTEEFRLSGSGTCTADASANYDIDLTLRSLSGTNQIVWKTPYKAASASAGSMPTWLGKECWMCNVAGAASFYYLHTVTVGSSPSTTITLRGFKYPNGAN